MRIQNEIDRTIKEQGIVVKEYSAVECEMFYNEIYKKYHNGKDDYPFWDNWVKSVSVYNKKGWSLISEFVGEQKSLLFLEKAEGMFIVELPNGLALYTLLKNTFGFVFYVSNEELDFLICFNDHDYLCGAGTACKWINSM